MKKTTLLRQMLNDQNIHIAPGVFDGMSARLAEQTGFDVIYASGGAIARSCGFPDIGIISFTEVMNRVGQMAEVTKVPVIADADTGFGNAINVSRTIKAFERAGIAGVHLEDQTFPKRCGHLDDKSLISAKEMAHKIRVAKDSQTDEDFVLIARTDAIAVEGFDAAIERSQMYMEAGADVIFVEAPETIEQIELIAKHIPQPKLINMFHSGKTPLVPKERLQELGYKFVIIPSDLQRATIQACQNTLSTILKYGDSGSIADSMASFSDREQIIRTKDYLAIDDGYEK
ncbi:MULTISPECIES: oxaloacetate decarboxylase [Pseudoalteromonas]|uniref:Isocitrate lyase n=1 Tax=Pseudoalteromonas rubra TaxID=43658 RepID=A0A5S3UTG9_9GAMM|nr:MULTISPECIES: oxaloacetate decarboxylase [Pseudoalteromonas]MCG7563448.1 oxaloacetate decarboxylase [Pseudoalteromonas sp. McH1-42]MEC4091419.1 oxaloacetate decarboxylase [Pseudoalteromonas rubra]QPB82416.1 isocitrate lyase [Pseudoalteromonas rubra]